MYNLECKIKMKYYKYILLFLGLWFAYSASAQNVRNVAFFQDGQTMVITYHLDQIADVIIQVSTDAGMTFSAPLQYVTGDVGIGVSPGNNQVVWDVLAEQDELVSDQIVFMVTAERAQQVLEVAEINDKPLIVAPKVEEKPIENIVPAESLEETPVTTPTASASKESESQTIFVVVEQMPSFPGGQEALFQYINNKIHYPIIALENQVQGRAICQFVVNVDGTLSDIVVVRSAGDVSLDKEAIRVVSNMPKWIPGMQRGKKVRVKYTLPVTFKIQEHN